MRKAEIIAIIKQKLRGEDSKKLPIARIRLVLDLFFETIKDCVSENKNIELRGFGTFEAKIREPRISLNPKTKEKVQVVRHAVPIFRAGKDFKEQVRATIDPDKI